MEAACHQEAGDSGGEHHEEQSDELRLGTHLQQHTGGRACAGHCVCRGTRLRVRFAHRRQAEGIAPSGSADNGHRAAVRRFVPRAYAQRRVHRRGHHLPALHSALPDKQCGDGLQYNLVYQHTAQYLPPHHRLYQRVPASALRGSGGEQPQHLPAHRARTLSRLRPTEQHRRALRQGVARAAGVHRLRTALQAHAQHPCEAAPHLLAGHRVRHMLHGRAVLLLPLPD